MACPGGCVAGAGTNLINSKNVDVDSSYCLNDIPAVPAVEGYRGKWVCSTGDFTNSVIVPEEGLNVWAEYEQNVFTVTFTVDDGTYQTDTYYIDDELELPADPVVEGKEFLGWYIGETKYNGGEAVDSDLTLTAKFKEEYFVNFVILADDGTVSETLSQYFRTGGETIGTMPQNPFVE